MDANCEYTSVCTGMRPQLVFHCTRRRAQKCIRGLEPGLNELLPSGAVDTRVPNDCL